MTPRLVAVISRSGRYRGGSPGTDSIITVKVPFACSRDSCKKTEAEAIASSLLHQNLTSDGGTVIYVSGSASSAPVVPRCEAVRGHPRSARTRCEKRPFEQRKVSACGERRRVESD